MKILLFHFYPFGVMWGNERNNLLPITNFSVSKNVTTSPFENVDVKVET
jgi:hypothetical protein